MDEGRYNKGSRNRNLKRTNCSPWNEGFEPYNHRPQYQEHSNHHQGYYQNESRCHSYQRNFNYRVSNNHEFSTNNQNNQHIPQEQSINIGNIILVTEGSVYNKSNIDSKDNTSRGNFQNTNFTPTGTNLKNRNPEHTFTNNQCNQELREVNEINTDSKNAEDNNTHPAAKIKLKKKIVKIKGAIEDKNINHFLEQLEKYISDHNIEPLSENKTNNMNRLNYNRLNQYFHFCKHFLELGKFIEALGNAAKENGVACKVGSTEAKLVKNESGPLKIFVQRDKKDLKLSDIVAIYIYDVDFRNHCERAAVQCGRGLSGIGNDTSDFGAVIVKTLKHVRLLYIAPINESKESSVKDILRSNNNNNNYIHIVTHYLLEMSNIESSFCGECNKVCINDHSHKGTPDVYKNDNKIDLKDIKTMTPYNYEKIKETNELIHPLSAPLSTICDRYKERILYWTKYFEENFLSKFKISAHEPYFKISSYKVWYQNNKNKFEIKTLKKILKDVQDPTTHRFICTVDKECKFDVTNTKDVENHMEKEHFTKLTSDELTKMVSKMIESEMKESRSAISLGTILECDVIGEEELNMPMRSNSFQMTVGEASLDFNSLCGLNSLFHSILFIYFNFNFATKALSRKFQNLIQSHLNKETGKSNQMMYEILLDFDNMINFQTDSINCKMEIASVIERVLCENIISKCKTCDKSKSLKYLSFYFENVDSLKYLQTRVIDDIIFECHSTEGRDFEILTDNLILMEISVSNELGKIKISDIPSKITIKNEEFEIWAVIVYTNNHFISLVFFKNRVIELNDLNPTPILQSEDLLIIPQVFIYKKKE